MAVQEIKKHANMLSPKMQRTIRVNENQLMMLSERAHYDHSLAGYLYKRTSDSSRWQLRWFVLYQNILFYYDNDTCHRPSGVVLLEGCYCERLITTGLGGGAHSTTAAHPGAAPQALPDRHNMFSENCFAISYRRENQRQYELRASSETECKNWIEAIREASFNKLLLQKEELEQKHLHLLQIVESEKTAKWQYTQQCEELASEIKKLRAELFALKKEWRPTYSHYQSSVNVSGQSSTTGSSNAGQTSAGGGSGTNGDSGNANANQQKLDEDTIEIRKIKKVQSFFRGWLCRRRWKQIVEQYIKSPHAESMRKRNSLVFRMVEAEEEYMEQMEVLVSCFLRPFKMAASSKKPPCSHEDVNSIFLNSETVLFLHQIFLKGLTARLESWPTLVLGDLFSMLLPMLSIYQEYVRNHHYSLQVLTECKQNVPFASMLARLENKPACQGRSLEQFLTYPMHQVPRYIITLHELLAHTPHDHVERKSLQNARQQLEDLSRQMHDEVSETENLRKNLALERMIVEGCDILLDVNQVFVRQGSLIHLPNEKQKSRSRLNFKSEKEAVRQCFLFSNHLIIATRTSGGRLHLIPDVGKIPLADALLIEDPSDHGTGDDDESVCSVSSQSSGISETSATSCNFHNRDFKIIVDIKKDNQIGQVCVHLVAPTIQEKAAWISDISQCMDNVHFNDLLHPTSDTSSVTMPHCIKNDPKLFKDDVDIRFSRTLNSCKIPQIRYATPERLLQRLTDLRFLSIDFLNTFLLTYRVFTDGVTVLEALKKVFYNIDNDPGRGSVLSLELSNRDENTLQLYDSRRRSSFSPRRTSGASSVSGYGSEMSDRDRSHSYDSQGHRPSMWRPGIKKYEDMSHDLGNIRETGPTIVSPPSQRTQSSSLKTGSVTMSPPTTTAARAVSIKIETSEAKQDTSHLSIPKVTASSSSETLTDVTVLSAPCSPSNLSSVTLVGSTGSDSGENSQNQSTQQQSQQENGQSSSPTKSEQQQQQQTQQVQSTSTILQSALGKHAEAAKDMLKSPLKFAQDRRSIRRVSGTTGSGEQHDSETEVVGTSSFILSTSTVTVSTSTTVHRASCTSLRSGSISTTSAAIQNYYGTRRSIQDEGVSISARASFQHDTPQNSSKAGVVITSFRQSKRRSSTSSAATAFAIATSGSSNPRDLSPSGVPCGGARSASMSAGGGSEQDGSTLSASAAERTRYKENVISTACTMRVLNVLRHWVSKHAQDFENDPHLKNLTIEFLEDIIYSPNLLPAEHKAAAQLLRLITKEEPESSRVDLDRLLAPPMTPSKESIETLSALEIAEQMTYIDHQIFISISSEEFLGQAWMKNDKAIKAPHILLMTRRFNEVSRLVVSEIMRRNTLASRVAAIEKWAAVADISRCLHNFNGVLQICAAFTNSAVYRLKRTWEKVSKTTKQTIEKLQSIVSSDGRFRSLRDALHRCDPPCIPYLGLYLTDLSFIEEGTPNFTQDGLLNFSKMRMIAHVIREIRHFQQTPYKIELITKVANYLLDSSLCLDDDELYRMSLEIEPRTSRLSTTTTITATTTTAGAFSTAASSATAASFSFVHKS